MSKQITSLELLTRFYRIDNKYLDMTASERLVLSVLITFINGEKIKEHGVYEAFPSGDILAKRTGLNIKTIERFRKSLSEKGWLTIQSGRGRGNANHYFIDVAKITAAYDLSNGKGEPSKLSKTDTPPVIDPLPVKPRNTTGLKRGRPSTEHTDSLQAKPWDEDAMQDPF